MSFFGGLQKSRVNSYFSVCREYPAPHTLSHTSLATTTKKLSSKKHLLRNIKTILLDFLCRKDSLRVNVSRYVELKHGSIRILGRFQGGGGVLNELRVEQIARSPILLEQQQKAFRGPGREQTLCPVQQKAAVFTLARFPFRGLGCMHLSPSCGEGGGRTSFLSCSFSPPFFLKPRFFHVCPFTRTLRVSSFIDVQKCKSQSHILSFQSFQSLKDYFK